MSRYRGKRIGLTGPVHGRAGEREHLEMSMPENVKQLLEPCGKRFNNEELREYLRLFAPPHFAREYKFVLGWSERKTVPARPWAAQGIGRARGLPHGNPLGSGPPRRNPWKARRAVHKYDFSNFPA
jgi:hypothetical protein